MYKSRYGQVNWDGFTVALPTDIVKAWKGKVMNIVGYE